jgi:hypothetical protein
MRMLTDLELSNWHRWRHEGPQGAFDSRRGGHPPVTLRDFGPGGAFDRIGFSRRRMARDDTGDLPELADLPADDLPDRSAGNPMKAMKMLAEKLTPEDWAEFQRILCGESGAEDEDLPESDIEELPENAMEGGMGGATDRRMAMDFTTRHPGAATVGFDTWNVGSGKPARKSRTQIARDGKNAKSFAERFPSADRIRTV